MWKMALKILKLYSKTFEKVQLMFNFSPFHTVGNWVYISCQKHALIIGIYLIFKAWNFLGLKFSIYHVMLIDTCMCDIMHQVMWHMQQTYQHMRVKTLFGGKNNFTWIFKVMTCHIWHFLFSSIPPRFTVYNPSNHTTLQIWNALLLLFIETYVFPQQIHSCLIFTKTVL